MTAGQTEIASRFRSLAGRARLLGGASAAALLLLAGQAAEAGNILVGSRLASPTLNATAAAMASVQQAAAMTQQSMRSLTRATQAIQAMQAAQSVARGLALSGPNNLGLDPNHPGQQLPNVPNGLAAGGLVPDSGLAGNGAANPVTSWTNANTPTQSTGNGQTTVTVQQTAQKAILNWQSFNIGKNTELYINQSAGNSSTGNDWIALNRVSDPSGVPSQILGSIKAEGSVYLINRNGIIFGGSAQVNVHSLIASSLDLFSSNLTDSNNRFLNGGIGDLNASHPDTALLTTSAPGAGDITLEPGASINVGAQGLALIAAPNVTNHGEIVTGDGGQVALIAGIGVFYDYNSGISVPGEANSTPFTDDGSTTFLVFFNGGKLTDGAGADITPVGVLLNDGLIETPTGNITLLGGAIQQNGVLASSTSISRPGSIVVTAAYEAQTGPNTFTGAVTFGANSLTTILPDTGGLTVDNVESSLAAFDVSSVPFVGITMTVPTKGLGLIAVNGQAIDVKGGSLIYAPGQYAGLLTETDVTNIDPRLGAVPGSGRIYVEDGATIDISGIAGALASVEDNILTLALTQADLADSPLQKDGFLYGTTVTVDLGLSGTRDDGLAWVGTPLATLGEYKNLITLSIDQLLTNGGAVAFNGGEVVLANGSLINEMGGYTYYQGGMINTTRLLDSYGHIFDISQADPTDSFVGIAGVFTAQHPRWGVTETFTSPLLNGGYYQPDYIAGGNAGHLDITSGAVVMDGTVLAGAVSGIRQVASGDLSLDGTLSILSSGFGLELGTADTLSQAGLSALTTPAGFSMDSPALASDPDRTTNALDTSLLTQSDYSSIDLEPAGGPITLDQGASLAVQNGGSITLRSPGATIDGTLTARSGSITVSYPVGSGGGDIGVRSTGKLDVSGIFTNDAGLLAPTVGGSSYVDGGVVTLSTRDQSVPGIHGAPSVDNTGDIFIDSGAVIDASGGGCVGVNGRVATTSAGLPVGQGGTVKLITHDTLGQPLPNEAIDTAHGGPGAHGLIEIAEGADVTALGLTGGGTLDLQTLSIQVGGDRSAVPSYGYYFDPAYWGDHGFGSFNLTSAWDTMIPATITLTHQNLVADADHFLNVAPLRGLATGTSLVDALPATTLPVFYRSPTNLSITAGLETSDWFSATYVGRTNFGGDPTTYGGDEALLAQGASILADPGASITLSSYVQTTVLGDISAPGGTVTLSVQPPDLAVDQGSLFVGKNSTIDVSGAVVLNPDQPEVWDPARRSFITPLTGKIYNGGTINLTAPLSAILVQSGAVLNVSGASGSFDVKETDTSVGGLTGYVRENQWSDAGTVSITGNGALLFEGKLIGDAGSSEAEGGTLNVTMARLGDVDGSDDNLVLVQGLAPSLMAAGITFDLADYTPSIAVHPGGGFGGNVGGGLRGGTMVLDANVLNNSGFTSLALSTPGNISYTGDVTLSLSRSISLSWTLTGAIEARPNLANNYGPNAPAANAATVWTNNDETPTLSLSAPYISLSGGLTHPFLNALPGGGDAIGSFGHASVTLSAGTQLDIAGHVLFQSIADATVSSGGDIRLLPPASAAAGTTMFSGAVLSTGDLSFDARRIYPATNTVFLIQSRSGTVSFGYPQNETADTATPLSVGGALVVDAANIVQEGDIVAPYGTIVLGLTNEEMTGTNGIVSLDNALSILLPSYAQSGSFENVGVATKALTLGAGSITSVSANGAVLPYGSTTDDTDWSYGQRLLTAPPTGVVVLGGGTVGVNAGATVNLSGGGDIQASEFVAGDGGSRNVLSQTYTSYANGSTTGQTVSFYPDNRAIYAIVPGLTDGSAGDPTMMNNSAIPVGKAVYLNGANGLPAGVYTLLPAQYATLPGAYRVVVNTAVSTASSTQKSYSLPDGTQVVTGATFDTLTGAKGSNLMEFYVQSGPVWKQYSQYDISTANQYFTSLAAANNSALARLPIDAGRIILDVTSSLSFAPGAVEDSVGTFMLSDGTKVTGKGVDLDISNQFIEINDSGVSDTTGYAAISASALEATGAESILIGGLRQITDRGLLITPTASGVIIANDASDPLSAAEIMVVAKPSTTTKTVALDGSGDTTTVTVVQPGTGSITVNPGAAIQASGSAGAGYDAILIGYDLANLPDLSGAFPLSGVEDLSDPSSAATAVQAYYAGLARSQAAFLRVSNGGQVTVQTPTWAQLHPSISVTDNNNATASYSLNTIPLAGSVSIGAGATVAGGNVLDIVSLSGTHVDAGANLSAKNMLLAGDAVTVVGNTTAGANGLVIGATTLANMAGSDSVRLESFGAFTFSGDVSVNAGDAALTLDAATVASDGGTVTLNAGDVAFANSFGASGAASAGTGSLSINAGEIDLAAGNKALSGFGSLAFSASKGVVGVGQGVLDLGGLDLTLATPIIIASAGSNQTLQTTGALSVTAPANGSALSSSDLGGAITLKGSSVSVATSMQALAAAITLDASAGDITLASGANLNVEGYAKTYQDIVEYAPAGAVTLAATGGTVTIAKGATVDFAGAADAGNAGSLSITATGATPATLAGTLLGSAAPTFTGGSLLIESEGAIDLDSVTDIVTAAGITNQVLLTSQNGDLTLSAGKTLKAFDVELVADGGQITINGVINASGTANAVNAAKTAGGSIELWGEKGVTLTGSLLARSAASNELGGTVEIGTSGTPNAVDTTDPFGTYNSAYGYENISAANSGTIALADSAVLDVSGGTVDGLSGGTVLLRAPLLETGGVNLTIGANTTVTGSRSTTLEEYATWSTADKSLAGTAKYFDGIIDPAGWYDSSGNLLPGNFIDSNGNVRAAWSGGSLTNDDGTTNNLTYYLDNYYFLPSTPNAAHQTFYGFVNGDDAAEQPGTLMGFIENANLGAVANFTGKSGFTQTVGVDLDNPVRANVNDVDIRVLSNWNLGATNTGGQLVFRPNGSGAAPYINLRAGNDLEIDASISDGFHQLSPIAAPPAPSIPGGFTLYSYNYIQANDENLQGFDLVNDYSLSIGDLPYNPSLEDEAFPAAYTAFGLASPDALNGYYGAYDAYSNIFLSQFFICFSCASFGGVYEYQYGSGGAKAPTAVTNALAAANAAYSSTDIRAYGAYLEAYTNFMQTFDNWANGQGSNAVLAFLPPAPLAPPVQSLPPPVLPPPTPTNSPDVVVSINNAAPIAGMALAAGVSSSSYRIVAGANVQSANPLAVVAGGSGNVTVDGHTTVSYLTVPYQIGTNAEIAMPTTVRTGAGSIDIAAPGDFELLDTVAPGVVYTAGQALQESSNATTIATNNSNTSDIILTPSTYTSGAGAITVNVGGNIDGVENVQGNNTTAGQLWTEWLLSDGKNGWYVNFGSFDQGILSLGGDVTVAAGGDIRNLSVSTPTTGHVVNASDGIQSLALTGGGNLLVEAGGGIYSGAYYVGQGSGTLLAGGDIASDLSVRPTATYDIGATVVNSGAQIATLLGYQYGSIDVSARGDVDIGGVLNPTYLGGTNIQSCASLSVCMNLSPFITSTDSNSGVSIASIGGDIAFNTLLKLSYFGSQTYVPLLLPASLGLTSYEGVVSIQHGGGLYPSSTGTLRVLAEDSVTISDPLDLLGVPNDYIVGNIPLWGLSKLGYTVGVLPTALQPNAPVLSSLSARQLYDPNLIVADADPVRLVALTGDITNGYILAANAAVRSNDKQQGALLAGTSGALLIEPNAPAEIYAGDNIVDLAFYGMNFTATDVSSIIAGGDITYTRPLSVDRGATPIIEMAGPGDLVVEAGGDISFPSQRVTGRETGIRTLGNSSDGDAIPSQLFPTSNNKLPLANLETYGNPYLPQGGASVTVLAGVGKGVDVAAFEAAYLDPATATTTTFLGDFAGYVGAYETSIGKPAGALSAADAWNLYETLSEPHKEAVVRQVFFHILDTTGKDYNDPASPNFHQYARGYQAIDTLFPAADGYTANSLSGGANGATTSVTTGSIDLRGSTIQTQQGGGITILAPGGRILVGSVGASPAVDPASEGIITLEKGDVDIFTDQSILVAQSRIFTEQGGDMVIWSSNGDVNAGQGAKTTVSFPPPVYSCDTSWYCVVDVKGAVAGAGIGTLKSLPDVPPGNVDLIAPRGTVDAGSAGIRASGNFNVAALYVANAFNIQVQGTATGIPMVATPNINALTTASNTAGQAAAAANEAASQTRSQPVPQDLPSIITVEVIGYGGGDGTSGGQNPGGDQHKKPEVHSQNPNSAVRVLGYGDLTEAQKRPLTQEEKSHL